MRSKCDISNFPDLFARCKTGNEEAFRCIFDHYYQPIKNNISRFVADSNSAADILQDVFLTLWEKKHTLPDEVNIEGWLFTVSYNKSVSFIRKSIKAPLELHDEVEEYASNTLSSNDIREKEHLFTNQLHLFEEAVEQLPPQRKTAFILYKVRGFSYQEISLEMGISELSARQYVKMSLQFLKQYVQSRAPEISVWSCILLGYCLAL